MPAQPLIALIDGNSIPQVGLGVWRTPQDVADTAVHAALVGGYRHIDTAAAYENEDGVGKGIRSSAVPRSEIFITTKLWNSAQGFDTALEAFDKSLARLGLDYIDLYLIHWPAPRQDRYVETWRALIRLKEEGRARSIGVSNFGVSHLDRIVGETGVVPVLNQIELHPHFQQQALRETNAKFGIATESWSPLGQGTLLTDSTIKSIAVKHGRSPAQIIVRWHLENRLIVIPKSVTASRIAENFNVFSFELDAADLAAIAKLDSPGGRIGPDPATATF